MQNVHPAAPNNLLEVVRYFSDPDVALQFMRDLRWPDGVTCPHCDAKSPSFLKSRRIWKCRECRKQFSVKVGTIFEDSALGLDKWLPALWLIANAKNGISSYELHRALKVTQKTAWFMLHRIRTAMAAKTFEKFSGDVEADETFVGGIAKNMHQSKRKRLTRNGAIQNKTVVVGLLQRGKKGKSRVRVSLDQNLKRHALHANIAANVEPGSTIHTDSFSSYAWLKGYTRKYVNHQERWVDGDAHTNGMENFWSLLKRTIKGTYVSIDPFHLVRYLSEQVFRFNEREGKDGDRFLKVVRDVVGRRITYKSLIGRDLEPATT